MTLSPTMTLSHILSALNNLNAEVTLCRIIYSFDNPAWSCALTINSGEAQIKVRKNAESGDLALILAFESLNALISSPTIAKTLNLPLLHAPVDFDEQGIA